MHQQKEKREEKELQKLWGCECEIMPGTLPDQHFIKTNYHDICYFVHMFSSKCMDKTMT